LNITTCNRHAIESCDLRPGTALISMFNQDNGPPVIKGRASCVDILQFCCHDATEPMGNCVFPNQEIADSIYSFYLRNRGRVAALLIQDENAISLAPAVAGALIQIEGLDATRMLRAGPYNRLIYKLLMHSGDKSYPAEPLVSIIVRGWNPADFLLAFMLSMKRQRYDNWQAVIITDGPRPDLREMLSSEWLPIDCHEGVSNSRVKLLETKETTGFWGHPLRQMGIDSCDGEIIGMNSDDNYLTPGYIEQLVWALQDGAELALSDTVHSYWGWTYQTSETRVCGADLGCWLAKAALVRMAKWPGNQAIADGEFIQAMAEMAGPKKVAYVRRPLWVHN
jgi:hypothetical protein